MRKWKSVYLGGLGALALVSLLFPILILYGFFFAIVPGILLWVAIPLFGYSLLAITVRNLSVNLSPWLSGMLVVLSLLLLAVLPPALANYLTFRTIAELRADDRSLVSTLPRIRTLAYLSRIPSQKTECREICQRLLFNGSVDSVLVGYSGRHAQFRQKVEKYRIEHAESCAPVEIPSVSEAREPWKGETIAKTVANRVIERMARGDCLVREPGTLDEADAVVIDYIVALGGTWTEQKHRYPRINSPQRVSVFVRQAKGLEEKFRQTRVDYLRVLMPFLFGYFGDAGAGAMIPPLGVHSRRATIGNYEIANVFADVLKLNANIPETRANARDLFRAAIADKSRPTGEAGLKLADFVLNDIATGEPRAGDEELVAAIVGDSRIPFPHFFPGAVRKLGPGSAKLAGPLLDRILNSPRPERDRDIYGASQAAILLPPRAFAGLKDKLNTIAADASRADLAYLALARLADSGAENVPSLRDRLRSGSDPRAALMALCRLGEEAKDAVPEVSAIVKQGMPSTHKQLVERTLVRISGPTNPAPEPSTDQLRGKIDPRPERARTDAVSVACRQ